jgi:hypothetical protein
MVSLYYAAYAQFKQTRICLFAFTNFFAAYDLKASYKCDFYTGAWKSREVKLSLSKSQGTWRSNSITTLIFNSDIKLVLYDRWYADTVEHRQVIWWYMKLFGNYSYFS